MLSGNPTGPGQTAIDADGLFAHVNDAIRQLATEGQVHETWEFLCECPDVGCHALVTLTLTEFDKRRTASPPVPICANHGVGLADGNGSSRQVSQPLLDGNGSVDGN